MTLREFIAYFRSSEIREEHQCDTLKLRSAVLCPDCNLISTSIHGRCRACDSEALSLEMILNKPRKAIRKRPQKAIEIDKRPLRAVR
jgi:hypothetical protein